MENIGLKGKFRIACLRDGEIIAEREFPNTIMNTGKAVITGLMLTDVGGTAFDYLAIGTSATAPSATNTALFGEMYRVASTGSQQTTTTTDDTARLTTSFAITGSVTLKEVGVFNSASGGTMLARTTYSDIAVQNEDTLNVSYDVVLS